MTESGWLVEEPYVKTGCLTREHDPLSGRVNTHVNKSGTAEFIASSLSEAKLLFYEIRKTVFGQVIRQRAISYIRRTIILTETYARSNYVRRNETVCHNGW